MSIGLRVVLALFVLSLVGLALTGAPIYSRLSYLWGLLLTGSWVWSRLALRNLSLQRNVRVRRAQVGQVFQERFEVHNSSRLPRLWLEVHDRSTLPGSQGSRVLTIVKGRERQSYMARTRLVRRGVFPLGPTVLTSGDPFGLFPVDRTVAPAASVLVYPTTVDVRAFPSPPGLLPGGEAVRRRTHQVTTNAAGVREYLPGDPLNRIHWPSTARRRRLIVKEFELDPLAEIWILSDADREVQAELPYAPPALAAEALWHPWEKVDLPPSTEEYSVSIAASLARYFLQRRRAVGLASCGPSLEVLPPDRGGRQLGKILEALALLRAEGSLPISALASAQAQHLPRGSTVILITPSTGREVALAIDRLLQRGLRPVAVLLDAASFGGHPGTDTLAAAIRRMSVPVCRVANGADLSISLSMTVSELVAANGRAS